MASSPLSAITRYFRKAPSQTVGSTVSAASSAPKLDAHTATDNLLWLLSRAPELDETLIRAGVTRHKLRVLLEDDEIFQATQTRLQALLSSRVRFEPDNSPAAIQVQALLEPHLIEAITGAFKAVLFGYSVMEAVYAPVDDGIGLAYLGEKPMQWFEPQQDGRLLYRPTALHSPADFGPQPLDVPAGMVQVDQSFKFFMTRNAPTWEQPRGQALLSRLYWPWYFRTNGWQFWGKFLERFGTPILVGSGAQDPNKMLAALLAAHSSAAIAVGEGVNVDVLNAGSGGQGANFEDFENACVRRMQKSVLGQTLSSGTDGGSGNRALGQVHENVRADKTAADKALVRQTLQHIVNALLQLNGHSAGSVTILFSDDKGIDLKRSERDKNLYAVGLRFTDQYVLDNYDLKDGDFTVSSAAAPPPVPVPDPQLAPQPNLQAAIHGQQHLQFSPGRAKATRFTPGQQVVEDLGDQLLADNAAGPFELTAIRAALSQANNPEELATHLAKLMQSLPASAYTAALERALFAGDVLGWGNAEQRRH